MWRSLFHYARSRDHHELRPCVQLSIFVSNLSECTLVRSGYYGKALDCSWLISAPGYNPKCNAFASMPFCHDARCLVVICFEWQVDLALVSIL